MAFQRMLVAIDYSDTSLRALQVAGDLASQLGAKLVIAHVVDARGGQFAFPELAPYVDVPALLKNVEDDARRQMPAFLKKAGLPDGLEPEVVIMSGIPVDDIIQIAKDKQADAIVMGTHGRSGFSRLWFGSVAEKIVRLAHRPVLTVGPAED